MHLLYFDPGTGAMIIQVIVAGIAGFVLFSKNLLYKVKTFFGIIKPKDDTLFDDIEVNDSKKDTKET